MIMKRISAAAAIGVVVSLGSGGAQGPAPGGTETIRRIAALTRASSWTLAASVPLGFAAHHPQGLVKIGDMLHMTAVDRAGLGHLFKFDGSGRLLAGIQLGEGTIF